MNKLTIVDGNSLLFRAYYATAYPGAELMKGPDGTPTNAIFAFSYMLNKIISLVKPGDGLFVAFDTGKPTFRKDVLDTYKANRKPAPQELILQFPLSREFLSCMGIYQYEKEGFEGDDIAGTVAKLAANQGMEVEIYTSDRDFLQLIDDKISINIIKKGMSDIAKMTPEKVLEEWGFEPRKIIDYKGLRGDSSDNLPGIPGIGEKTASKLIQEYGDFNNIVAHADDIGGKIGNSIKEHHKIGRISRDLAVIQTNIEIPFSLNDLIYEGYDLQKLSAFCQKLGLKQFINKVFPKWKKSSEINIDLTVNEITNTNDIIFENAIGIALDYEIDDYTNSPINGIAFTNKDITYYISFSNAQNDQKLLDILKDNAIEKYCFDYKAIKVCLAKENIEISNVKFDILLASYLLDSSIKNNVDSIFESFGISLGSNDDDYSLFSTGNPKKTGKIAYFSKKLSDKLLSELSKIDALNLFNNLELPLSETLANIEIEGFPLDIATLDSLGTIWKEKLSTLEQEIYEIAGENFNISSPKQLGEILFNKLGLSSNKKLSTNVDVLKDLINDHPIISKILEYRKYFKLVTTYVEGLKVHIHDDGKIHAKFNQALTTTGRLSSSEPNLQNISVRDEEGKLLRKAFFYPNNEFEILSLDYSQIELRVLASLSDCKGLKNVFNSSKDIHSETAKVLFNLSREPNDSQRRKAKTVNFGIVYGISDWGLADQLEISNKEAKSLIDGFYNAYPEIGEFFQDIITKATNDGYVSTMLGRRRYLNELHDSNYQTREFAKRAAMNAPIQGTAADLIKIAMINVEKALKDNNFKSKMILQIHDELLFKVYKDEKEKLFSLVKNTMVNALKLEVPLEVDGGFGKDWYECK